MKSLLKTATAGTITGAVTGSFLHYRYGSPWLLALAITLGTIAYHLTIRLLVGGAVNFVMRNHADYHKKWYQLRPHEERLYGFLRVKQWKGKLPAYEPEWFSPRKHTFDEIAQAMCQSEIVHEINVILSFLPMLASVWFGSFGVFCATSVAAACIDMLFVIVQRYNRPRIVSLAERQKGRSKTPQSV